MIIRYLFIACTVQHDTVIGILNGLLFIEYLKRKSIKYQ